MEEAKLKIEEQNRAMKAKLSDTKKASATSLTAEEQAARKAIADKKKAEKEEAKRKLEEQNRAMKEKLKNSGSKTQVSLTPEQLAAREEAARLKEEEHAKQQVRSH